MKDIEMFAKLNWERFSNTILFLFLAIAICLNKTTKIYSDRKNT